MKKTAMKILRNILVVSLIGLFLIPLTVLANETTSVKSGGNDIGIEFEEDYVPAPDPVPNPTPDPTPKPIQEQPIKKVITLPQTGESSAIKSTMVGGLLVLGIVMLQQKRRGTIEKE